MRDFHFVRFDNAKIGNFLDMTKEIPNYFYKRVTFR